MTRCRVFLHVFYFSVFSRKKSTLLLLSHVYNDIPQHRLKFHLSGEQRHNITELWHLSCCEKILFLHRISQDVVKGQSQMQTAGGKQICFDKIYESAERQQWLISSLPCMMVSEWVGGLFRGTLELHQPDAYCRTVFHYGSRSCSGSETCI